MGWWLLVPVVLVALAIPGRGWKAVAGKVFDWLWD